MKTTNCAYLVLLVYGIISFELPVSCDPTNESQQDERPELIDVDIKNIDSDKLEVLKSQERPEVRKIAPKNNKIIKSINIDGHTIWELNPYSKCLNILIFFTNSDKILFVLNTLYNKYKFFINFVYDLKGGDTSGHTSSDAFGGKVTYMGLLPFLIELNREFGKMNEYESEVWGTELNIEDFFDKLYHKYSYEITTVYTSRGKTILKRDVYENNDSERFLRVRDMDKVIWRSNDDCETRDQPCKKVEVFYEFDHVHLLKLTFAEEKYVYFKYYSGNKNWDRCGQTEFEKRLEELGFPESTISSEETVHKNVDPETELTETVDVGTNTLTLSGYIDPGVKCLDFQDINTDEFYIIKNRVSQYHILTVIPKGKRWIDCITFKGRKLDSVHSDDYIIVFMKYMNLYYIEFILRHKDNTYECSYFDVTLDSNLITICGQFIFYNHVIGDIEGYDVHSCIKYKHFDLLDELSRLADPTKYKKLLKNLPVVESAYKTDKGDVTGFQKDKYEFDFPYTVRLSNDGNEILYTVGQ